MEIEWDSGAREDLESFDKELQERVLKHIDGLKDRPLGENTSLLTKRGLKIYRLKLKNGSLDHRVFFDLDGDMVLILGVEHRDDAYTQNSIEKIESRL